MPCRKTLEFDDDILAEDELTPEQWKELDKRVKDAESGKAEFISIEDFKKKVRQENKWFFGLFSGMIKFKIR
jgi:hypothetical protein